MREILFRGKSIKTGQWVEGFFVNCCSTYDDPDTDRVAEIVEVNADRIYKGEYRAIDTYPVDPETVGQFTGFVDKNGNKIFEGDILSRDAKIGKIIRHVIYDSEFAEFEFHNNNHGFLCLSVDNDKFEIIGNIHDNPELAEVK